jgi:hypothetical protein
MLVLLLVVVFNTSKLICVWIQSVSFGVSLLQTNTNTSIQTSNVVIISKKREEGIRSRAQETGRGSQDGQWRNCYQSMAESRAAEVVIPM